MGKASLKWYWMPAVFLLLGVLASALYILMDRFHERQHDKYLTIAALMDVQIRTSTFHLWFEENLAGDTAVDMKEVWEDYDRAVALVGAILAGGETEHGLIVQPLAEQSHRIEAERIRTQLSTLKTIALIRMREPLKAGIGSVLDHKFDTVFGTILMNAAGLELALQDEESRYRKQTERIQAGIILAWALIMAGAAAGLLSLERRRSASAQALRTAHDQLLKQAGELKEHREHLKELVEIRTRELTAANEGLMQEVAERRLAEDALRDSQTQLRQLSARLLSAQEEERNKISRELHDGLGQSLTLIKFQVRSVFNKLRDDQGPLREECEDSLAYIKTVIENVRRISKDLSPVVLEDLGLAKALRLLADDFTKTCGLRINLNVAEVDELLSRSAQTGIYRIVQEALTNVVKHSGAASAGVVIGKGAGSVAVLIEDDGKGFLRTEAARSAAWGGLGLASMEERVGMLGGALSLRSEPGKGTHIAFNIPINGTSPPDGTDLDGEVVNQGNDARPV